MLSSSVRKDIKQKYLLESTNRTIFLVSSFVDLTECSFAGDRQKFIFIHAPGAPGIVFRIGFMYSQSTDSNTKKD